MPLTPPAPSHTVPACLPLPQVRRRRPGGHRGPAPGLHQPAALEPTEELGGERGHAAGRLHCFDGPHLLLLRAGLHGLRAAAHGFHRCVAAAWAGLGRSGACWGVLGWGGVGWGGATATTPPLPGCPLAAVGIISLVADVIESLPINQAVDDNLSVPGVAAFMGILMLQVGACSSTWWSACSSTWWRGGGCGHGGGWLVVDRGRRWGGRAS